MHKSHKALNRAVAALALFFMIETAAVILFLSTDAAQYQHKMNLARRYLANSEYESAVETYTAAINIQTDSGEAYMGRGDAYAGLGDKERAGSDYGKAREIDPDLNRKIERKLEDLFAGETRESAENPQ